MKQILPENNLVIAIGDVVSFFIHPDNFFVRDPKKPNVDVSIRIYNEYLKEFPRGVYHIGTITEIFKNRVDDKIWATIYSIHLGYELSIPKHNILKFF